MVAPRKEIWLEPNYGCEATQSGSPNFPNVYRGNCRDPILVVVGKFNDNIMSFVAIIDGWWAD